MNIDVTALKAVERERGIPADTVTGRVTAVDGDGVTLAVEAKGKPGAKKRPPTPRQVPWRELGAGRVQVEFGRGADESLADGDLGDDEGGDQ